MVLLVFFCFIFLFKKWVLNSTLLFFMCCRLSDPSQYQSIVDAEWNIIYDKLDRCVQSGAKVVLSRLAIGDLATQVGTFHFLSASFLSFFLSFLFWPGFCLECE